MHLINISRDNFLKPLMSVIGVVERRHTLPILSNVLITQEKGILSFNATDLEIQIDSHIKLTEPVIDFSLTVAAKKLYDICRALPDGLMIHLEKKDDGRLQIKAENSRFSLQTLPANDFPRFNRVADESIVLRLSQAKFKSLLNRVHYAMAQQDIRYYLNGLLLEIRSGILRVVATDGHRLAFATMPLLQDIDEKEVILPRKTVIELTKLFSGESHEDDLLVEISANQIQFSFGNISLVSKVVDGKFPDYNKVIPTENPNSFVIDRLVLLQLLQRASILSNEKFRGVRLILTQNSLRVICNNSEQEEAQEEVAIDYDGKPLDIGFSVTYLLDVLNNINQSAVELSFSDANSSSLVTIPGNDTFKYVVMPMRI